MYIHSFYIYNFFLNFNLFTNIYIKIREVSNILNTYTHTHVHIHIHTHNIYIQTCTYTHTHTYIETHTHTRTHIHININTLLTVYTFFIL